IGLVFGLAPAWHSTGSSMMQTIATDSRTTARAGRLRHLLVGAGQAAAAEVSAAVLVLSAAVLLLRTLVALQHMDAGYRAQDALTMLVNLPMPLANSARRSPTT